MRMSSPALRGKRTATSLPTRPARARETAGRSTGPRCAAESRAKAAAPRCRGEGCQQAVGRRGNRRRDGQVRGA